MLTEFKRLLLSLTTVHCHQCNAQVLTHVAMPVKHHTVSGVESAIRVLPYCPSCIRALAQKCHQEEWTIDNVLYTQGVLRGNVNVTWNHDD